MAPWLFRVWVIVAGVWILLIGAFGAAAVIKPSVYIPDEAYVFEAPTSPPTAIGKYGKKYDAAIELQKRGLLIHFGANIQGVTAIEMFFPAATPKKDMKAAGDEQIRLVAAAVDARRNDTRWQALQWTFAGALVPPVIVLALGSLVGWALAGFRPTLSGP